MSNNKFTDALEEWLVEGKDFGESTFTVAAIMSLILELQTLNETLKEVLKPSTQAERGADGT